MSNDLRRYVSASKDDINRTYGNADKMDVTATVYRKRGVQFTLDREYVTLSEEQARDLAVTLLRRLDSEDRHVEATAPGGRWGTMQPDGSLTRR
jgi:hypothetical protein